MTEHDVRAATAKALPGYDVFTMSVGDGFIGVGIVAANGHRNLVRARDGNRPDFAVDMLRMWLEEEPERLREKAPA